LILQCVGKQENSENAQIATNIIYSRLILTLSDEKSAIEAYAQTRFLRKIMTYYCILYLPSSNKKGASGILADKGLM